jgi:hypothetical protein
MITIVTLMSTEQLVRRLRRRSVAECEIHISGRSETQEIQAARLKLGASVRRAVVCALYHDASIIMTARAC